jgi:pyruvate dehydrogenase E1 component alpha subunit
MLTEAQFLDIERTADEEVAQAVAFAEAGSWEPVADLARDLYAGAP